MNQPPVIVRYDKNVSKGRHITKQDEGKVCPSCGDKFRTASTLKVVDHNWKRIPRSPFKDIEEGKDTYHEVCVDAMKRKGTWVFFEPPSNR